MRFWSMVLGAQLVPLCTLVAVLSKKSQANDPAQAYGLLFVAFLVAVQLVLGVTGSYVLSSPESPWLRALIGALLIVPVLAIIKLVDRGVF